LLGKLGKLRQAQQGTSATHELHEDESLLLLGIRLATFVAEKIEFASG